MANPNIVAVTSIYGKTDVLSVGTAATTITSNPTSSGKVFKINTLLVSNTDGSNSIDINVDLYRNSAAYYVAKTISVPADSTIVVIGRDNPIYLIEGDDLRVAGSSASASAVCSYEEIA